MMMMLVRPAATASSMTYWMIGLSTSGSISFGCALVAGRKRVPSPAAGRTALRTLRPLLVCAELGVFEGVLVIGQFSHTPKDSPTFFDAVAKQSMNLHSSGVPNVSLTRER